MKLMIGTFVVGLALVSFYLFGSDPIDARVSTMPGIEDYTLLWWANGSPYIFNSSNTNAQSTETLCLQSGLWGLAFDTKNVRALRAGRWAKPMAVEKAIEPGRAELLDLPAVGWDCSVFVAGRKYACVGRMVPKDDFFQPVRFVETGRFFQRVVIEGLKFADDAGQEFPCDARLEISAWPDRLALRLEVTPKDAPADAKISIRVGDRESSQMLNAATTSVQATLFDESSTKSILQSGRALKAEYDDSLGCHVIHLPEENWSNAKGTYYPEEHLDQLDRWPYTLQNDSEQPAIARLMFTQKNPTSITGFTSMLCEVDGTPTGLPVQISKNWHRRPEKGMLLHEGLWFHGCAYVRLAPKSKRELVFQIVHARYGGIFAASLAQLSLIGWAHNQFWDQTAIGSFGESICFEPGRVQRRCFIDDVRPLMTLPHGETVKPWGWAENCGGGDFLMWLDEKGTYQPMRATRTNYRAYGPCLTDAEYSEESMGGEVSSRMNVSVPRSDDYLRTFIHIRYDVRRPTRWQRLAFFQLGSDFYNETPSSRVAIGDTTGMREEWEPKRVKDVYDRKSVPLTGAQPWVSIHGLERQNLAKGSAAASRGFVVRKWHATLGGKHAPQPNVSIYCTSHGITNLSVIELAPPAELNELIPGDFVEADLELLVFPVDAQSYYGPNNEFKKALITDADTWRPVQREAVQNALNPRAIRGTVLNSYPLRIAVDDQQRTEVTVERGTGFVPITITGLTSPDGYKLSVDGQRIDQSVHGNDFWQTDFNPAAKSWQQTFNISMANGQSHTIRFERKR